MTHLSLLDHFQISEEDKPIMDWQMKRMVSFKYHQTREQLVTLVQCSLLVEKQTQDKKTFG